MTSSNWRVLQTVVKAVAAAMSLADEHQLLVTFLLVTSDNLVSSYVASKLSARSPELLPLIHQLRAMLVPRDVQLAVRHIPGPCKVIANADSHLGEQAYQGRPLSHELVGVCQRLTEWTFTAVRRGGSQPPDNPVTSLQYLPMQSFRL
jgi:hypothetical protein